MFRERASNCPMIARVFYYSTIIVINMFFIIILLYYDYINTINCYHSLMSELVYCAFIEPDDQLNPKKKIFEQIQVSKLLQLYQYMYIIRISSTHINSASGVMIFCVILSFLPSLTLPVCLSFLSPSSP